MSSGVPVNTGRMHGDEDVVRECGDGFRGRDERGGELLELEVALDDVSFPARQAGE